MQELAYCGSGNVGELRCRNRYCRSGSGSAALLCPVVLVSFTPLKSAVSKRNRHHPQVTFGIVLKRAGADFILEKSFWLTFFSSKKSWWKMSKLEQVWNVGLGHLLLCPPGAVEKKIQWRISVNFGRTKASTAYPGSGQSAVTRKGCIHFALRPVNLVVSRLLSLYGRKEWTALWSLTRIYGEQGVSL